MQRLLIMQVDLRLRGVNPEIRVASWAADDRRRAARRPSSLAGRKREVPSLSHATPPLSHHYPMLSHHYPMLPHRYPTTIPCCPIAIPCYPTVIPPLSHAVPPLSHAIPPLSHHYPMLSHRYPMLPIRHHHCPFATIHSSADVYLISQPHPNMASPTQTWQPATAARHPCRLRHYRGELCGGGAHTSATHAALVMS